MGDILIPCSTRVFHLSTNDASAIQSIYSGLKVGPNQITEEFMEMAIVDLNTESKGCSQRENRIRRQVARSMWDLFHSGWDKYPY